MYLQTTLIVNSCHIGSSAAAPSKIFAIEMRKWGEVFCMSNVFDSSSYTEEYELVFVAIFKCCGLRVSQRFRLSE